MEKLFLLDELHILDEQSIVEHTERGKAYLFRSVQQLEQAIKKAKNSCVLCLHTDPDILHNYCQRIHKRFNHAHVLPAGSQLLTLVLRNLMRMVPEINKLIPARLLDIIDKKTIKPAEQVRSDRDTIIGNSKAIQNVFAEIALVAPTDYHVMIYGASGTGKEAVARRIHSESRRNQGPFIAIDCGSLMPETAMSELFGYVKGAFTDATTDKAGAFEMAHRGTLFLDEVAHLSYDVQIGLLRAIQEQSLRRVGSITPIEVDVRIITATNQELRSEKEHAGFRQDLFYRLNEFSIELPPLEQRKEDIPAIAAHFIASACKEINVPAKQLSPEVLYAFSCYHWPGNVRELKNIIRRCCLVAHRAPVIETLHLPPEWKAPDPEPSAGVNTEDQGGKLKDVIQRAEYEQILAALKEAQYNKRKAASLLNIHRKTLYNKLKQMERQG